MYTATVIGRITRTGHYRQHDRYDGTTRYGTLPPERYATEVGTVPIRLEHDRHWQIGELAYIERSRALGLMAVARIDRELLGDTDGDWYWSPGVRSYEDTDDVTNTARAIHLRELSLVRHAGHIGAYPVRITPVDLSADTGSSIRNLPPAWHDVTTRAHTVLQRRYRDPVTIVDVDLEDLVTRARANLKPTPRPAAVTSRAAPHTRPPTRRRPYMYDSGRPIFDLAEANRLGRKLGIEFDATGQRFPAC